MYDRHPQTMGFPVGDQMVEELNSDNLKGRAESAQQKTNETHVEDRTHTPSLPDRREILRQGRKLAFVVPVVMTFSAKDAFAAGSNHSCYAMGHACPGTEPCCDDMVCSGGQCTNETCVEAGGLCFADSDCCSGDCQLGACQ